MLFTCYVMLDSIMGVGGEGFSIRDIHCSLPAYIKPIQHITYYICIFMQTATNGFKAPTIPTWAIVATGWQQKKKHFLIGFYSLVTARAARLHEEYYCHKI